MDEAERAIARSYSEAAKLQHQRIESIGAVIEQIRDQQTDLQQSQRDTIALLQQMLADMDLQVSRLIKVANSLTTLYDLQTQNRQQ